MSAASRILISLAAAGAMLGMVAGISSVRPALSQTLYDADIEESKSQLEELKRQAEAKREKAKQFAKEERGWLERLAKAEEALQATRKYISRLAARQEKVQDEIRRTLVDLSWAQDELTSRRGELARRLRYSYMYAKTRTLEVVFSADSFPNLLQRTAFFGRVLQQDRRLIALVEEREAEVAAKLAKLEGQRTELELLQLEKAEEEEQYEALKSERAASLASVRNQKKANESAARELDQAALQLQQVLTELERKRHDALRRNNRVLDELDRRNFAANRGRLPWPVKGDIVTRFGRHRHPKYKTETISNGLDIAAEEGTPVRAVGDAVVDMARWLPGYGQTVILNHGLGYYTVYGHLASVAVRTGERLEPGDVLGTVGDTGSLKGTCLHFEVRRGGAADDPLTWLR